MRLLTILAALALTFGHGSHFASAQEQSRPNIIFILADDQGIDGVGCYGSDRFKGKTPNIDRLAAEGIRFTHCYANPACGPSRATLMTGRYVFRTGAVHNENTGNVVAQHEIGIAKVLRQAGYATCQVGKWRQLGNWPGDWGFDESVTDPDPSGWYWRDSYIQNGRQVKLKKKVYFPDVMDDFAIDFIRRNKDKPFFLYYSAHLIHVWLQPTPDSKPGASEEQIYDDSTVYLDKEVGKLTAELDALKLRERTLVVYAGDNGCAQEPSTINGRKINGKKGTLLEGGSRVPLVANWKGVTPKGKVLDNLIDFSDMFPTFAELGRAKLPEGVTIDGHSFAPRLHGQVGNPRPWVYVQWNQNWYVRERGYKLWKNGGLLDMSDAPFVERSIPAAAQDAAAKAARQRLRAVLGQLNPAAGKSLPDIEDAKGKPRTKNSGIR